MGKDRRPAGRAWYKSVRICSPYFSPVVYRGRRLARCDRTYSESSARCSVSYAFAADFDLRPTTTAPRRPRYGAR